MKLLTILFAFIVLQSQDNVVIKLSSKPELFTTDNLDNVYVYQNNTLGKYNSEGKLVAQHSSFELGQIKSIDTSDPFQIILFYKEFNTILLLDNKLNQIGKAISLDELNFSNIDAVCKSKEFGIWLLDSYSQKLILYSFNAKGITREISLLKYTKPLLHLDFILENGNNIYLSANVGAIWVFDQMGGKLHLIEEYPKSGFQIMNHNLLYSDNKLLYQYNLETEKKDSILIKGFSEFEKIRVGERKLFVLNADSISIIPRY